MPALSSDLFLPEASLPEEPTVPVVKDEGPHFLPEDTSAGDTDAALHPRQRQRRRRALMLATAGALLTVVGLGLNEWDVRRQELAQPLSLPAFPRHPRSLSAPVRRPSSRPRNSSRPPGPNIYSVGVNHTEQLKALDDARWRIATALTVAMMVLYFGFILLVAYAKPLLGRLVVPGLSLGILLGALVIIAAWVLIWIYVRWANTHYDAAIEALRDRA